MKKKNKKAQSLMSLVFLACGLFGSTIHYDKTLPFSPKIVDTQLVQYCINSCGTNSLLKIYSFFSMAPERKLAGVALQFYKKFVYENKWPKEVVLRVFKHLQPSIFLFSFSGTQKIQDIALFKQKNQLTNDYYHASIKNKAADFIVETMFLSYPTRKLETREAVAGKHSATDNNNTVFEFNNRIATAFCSRKYLIVELIDEIVQRSNIAGYIHDSESPYPKNHRIEIYDIKTKKKVVALPLPLPKRYQFNKFLFSLYGVDCKYIYLADHTDNSTIVLPYQDINLEKFIDLPKAFLFVGNKHEIGITEIVKKLLYQPKNCVWVVVLLLLYHSSSFF